MRVDIRQAEAAGFCECGTSFEIGDVVVDIEGNPAKCGKCVLETLRGAKATLEKQGNNDHDFDYEIDTVRREFGLWGG